MNKATLAYDRAEKARWVFQVDRGERRKNQGGQWRQTPGSVWVNHKPHCKMQNNRNGST